MKKSSSFIVDRKWMEKKFLTVSSKLKIKIKIVLWPFQGFLFLLDPFLYNLQHFFFWLELIECGLTKCGFFVVLAKATMSVRKGQSKKKNFSSPWKFHRLMCCCYRKRLFYSEQNKTEQKNVFTLKNFNFKCSVNTLFCVIWFIVILYLFQLLIELFISQFSVRCCACVAAAAYFTEIKNPNN